MGRACMHCRAEIELDPAADAWRAADSSLTCSHEQRVAAGTAPAVRDVFDTPDPRLDGRSYREATFARNDPILSGHLMPFMHLPEPDYSWTETDSRFAHCRPRA